MMDDCFKKRSFWSGRPGSIFIVELIKIVVICLVIVIPVRYFLVQPFYVKGASMEPSFYDHEYLIIDEITYRFRHPQRGEIVVFKYPRDTRQYFIKRIVALPGERISIADSKVVIYNHLWPKGRELDESDYLSAGMTTAGLVNLQLGDDQYFVLGDNRHSSLDSRVFGAVPRKNIVGRTWLRGWPINRADHFALPEYNL